MTCLLRDSIKAWKERLFISLSSSSPAIALGRVWQSGRQSAWVLAWVNKPMRDPQARWKTVHVVPVGRRSRDGSYHNRMRQKFVEKRMLTRKPRFVFCRLAMADAKRTITLDPTSEKVFDSLNQSLSVKTV